MESTLSRIDVWDGWRGIAISLLLIGHFTFSQWIWEERLGVDIFFVLSGMLMSKILFEKRVALREFYIRRFSRVYPTLLLFIIVVYSVALLAEWSFSRTEVIANLTFIRTYYPSDPHIWNASTPTGHLWSLNVEEHAYVIMSVVTLFVARKHNSLAATTLLVMAFTSIGICFAKYSKAEHFDHASLIGTECAISFIFMSAGYGLLKSRYEISSRPATPLITLLLAITCYLSALPAWFQFTVAPLLLAFTVNHLEESGSLLKKFLCMGFLRQLGLASYSIYLWQQPFYQFHYAIPGGAIVALLASLVAGFMCFYFFENPVRLWINQNWT